MTPVLQILYRSIIDDSRSVNDTFRIIRVTVVSDATTWSVTYDHHSDNSRGVIYDRNILIIVAILFSVMTSR